MSDFDKNKTANPTTFTLQPYIVYEPKEFTHHFNDQTIRTTRCRGSQAQKILQGDLKALEDYIEFKNWCGLPRKDTTKITHQGEVIYQVGSLVIELAYGGNLRSRQFDSPKDFVSYHEDKYPEEVTQETWQDVIDVLPSVF